MAFTYTWDETKPAGNRSLNLGDDDIREFKAAIRERFAVDHRAYESESGETNVGAHNQCSLIEQASDVAALANALRLYAKLTGSYAELYSRHENAGVNQLTLNGKLWIPALNIASLTRGDLLRMGASAMERVALGASGKYVKSDGTDAVWGSIVEGDIDYSNLPNGAVVQQVHTQYATYASGSTAFPDDDTIPKNTEGDQYFTRTITPKDTTHRLLIEVIIHCSCDGDNQVGVALFQDTTADALAAVSAEIAVPQWPTPIVLIHEMAANTTDEITFKVRAGKGNGGNLYVNGSSAARLYGTRLISSITITEIKA